MAPDELTQILPPDGTDIGLCTNNCVLQCHYEQETNGVCSNRPEAFASEVASHGLEILSFEVLSSKSCTIYS